MDAAAPPGAGHDPAGATRLVYSRGLPLATTPLRPWSLDQARRAKVLLHEHLEGTVKARTWLEIARRNGITLPANTGDELRGLFQFTNLRHFIDVWLTITNALRTREDFQQVAIDFAESAAAQGAVYIEGIFSPTRPVLNGLSWEALFDGYTSAIPLVAQRFGVILRLTPDMARNLPIELAEECARWAVAYRDRGVVGLGLGGLETLEQPTSRYATAFQIARDGGLGIVPHAGEAVGPEAVWDALTVDPERIRHGITASADPALMAELARRGVVLDICLTSNRRTGITDAGQRVRVLRGAGVRVSVSTDDPALFGTDILHEYEMANAAGIGGLAAFEAGIAGLLAGDEVRAHLRSRAAERRSWWEPGADPDGPVAVSSSPSTAPAVMPDDLVAAPDSGIPPVSPDRPSSESAASVSGQGPFEPPVGATEWTLEELVGLARVVPGVDGGARAVWFPGAEVPDTWAVVDGTPDVPYTAVHVHAARGALFVGGRPLPVPILKQVLDRVLAPKGLAPRAGWVLVACQAGVGGVGSAAGQLRDLTGMAVLASTQVVWVGPETGQMMATGLRIDDGVPRPELDETGQPTGTFQLFPADRGRPPVDVAAVYGPTTIDPHRNWIPRHARRQGRRGADDTGGQSPGEGPRVPSSASDPPAIPEHPEVMYDLVAVMLDAVRGRSSVDMSELLARVGPVPDRHGVVAKWAVFALAEALRRLIGLVGVFGPLDDNPVVPVGSVDAALRFALADAMLAAVRQWSDEVGAVELGDELTAVARSVLRRHNGLSGPDGPSVPAVPMSVWVLEGLTEALRWALAAQAALSDQTLSLRVDGAYVTVPLSSVRWVKKDGDYVVLHTSNTSYRVRLKSFVRVAGARTSLAALGERWAAFKFVRLHKSYLARIDAITGLRSVHDESAHDVRTWAVLDGGTELPVSTPNVAKLRDWLTRDARGATSVWAWVARESGGSGSRGPLRAPSSTPDGPELTDPLVDDLVEAVVDVVAGLPADRAVVDMADLIAWVTGVLERHGVVLGLVLQALALSLYGVLAQPRLPQPPPDELIVPIRLPGQTFMVRLSSVRYVELRGRNVVLHTGDKRSLVVSRHVLLGLGSGRALGVLARRWAPAGFVRVNQSCLVQARFVTAVRKSGAGDVVEVDGRRELPIGSVTSQLSQLLVRIVKRRVAMAVAGAVWDLPSDRVPVDAAREVLATTASVLARFAALVPARGLAEWAADGLAEALAGALRSREYREPTAADLSVLVQLGTATVALPLSFVRWLEIGPEEARLYTPEASYRVMLRGAFDGSDDEGVYRGQLSLAALHARCAAAGLIRADDMYWVRQGSVTQIEQSADGYEIAVDDRRLQVPQRFAPELMDRLGVGGGKRGIFVRGGTQVVRPLSASRGTAARAASMPIHARLRDPLVMEGLVEAVYSVVGGEPSDPPTVDVDKLLTRVADVLQRHDIPHATTRQRVPLQPSLADWVLCALAEAVRRVDALPPVRQLPDNVDRSTPAVRVALAEEMLGQVRQLSRDWPRHLTPAAAADWLLDRVPAVLRRYNIDASEEWPTWALHGLAGALCQILRTRRADASADDVTIPGAPG